MNQFKTRKLFLNTSLLVAGACIASTASAQFELEEILVTAQKRSETVQDIPLAVSALSGKMLDERGLTQPSDLQFVVPGLSGGTLQGDTSLTIRGVGLTVLGSSPGVAVHIDGVYQPRASMGDLAQIDIERVEVVRGPQGTLYGRNANGGAVNFITAAPGEELGGYIKAMYQEYDETRIQGAINVPINDNIRARLVADSWERNKGFIENLTPGGQDLEEGDSQFLRLRVDTDITDNLNASLIATNLEREGSFTYFTNIDGPTNFNLTPPAGPPINPALATVTPITEPRTTRQNDPAYQDREYTAVTAIVNYNISDNLSLKSISGYQDYQDDSAADFDATEISGAPFEINSNDKTLSQELNLNFLTDAVEGVVGLFYMDQEYTGDLSVQFVTGAANLQPPTVPANSPLRAGLPAGSYTSATWDPSETKTEAIFGDIKIHITDSFRLMAGIRYSVDTVDTVQTNFVFSTRTNPPPAAAIPGNIGAPCDAVETNQEFKSTTPRLVAQYDSSENGMIYGSVAKGFKSGGINVRNGCAGTYDEEEVIAYEVGTKYSLMDGRVTVNSAAFYYDYTDLQVSQLEGFAFITTNAPAAEVLGFEIDANAMVSEALNINGNFTYLDATYDEYSNLDILNADAGTQDLNGNPLPNAPKVAVNLGFAYDTNPILAGGYLTFRGSVSYKSRTQFREFDNDADSQPGYSIINGSVDWTNGDETLLIRVFGKNLTDEDYYAGLNQNAYTGSRFVSWGAPRQIGLEVRKDF